MPFFIYRQKVKVFDEYYHTQADRPALLGLKEKADKWSLKLLDV